MKIYTTRRGIALLIFMFLGTLMVLTSIGVKDTVVTGLRGGTAVELSTQAYYAASSGLRHAMYEALQNPVGFNGSGSWTGGAASTIGVDASGAGTTNAAPSATWEIVGRLENESGDFSSWQRNGRFILPYPGSGDAGDGCSFRNAVLENGAAYAEINDPCNWGKLGVGEAVSIPLYADDPDSSDPNDVISTAELFGEVGGTPELRLKLRTDCDPAYTDDTTTPENCQRARLLENPTDDGLRSANSPIVQMDRADGVDNDTIILWEIVGECADGDEMEVCVLQPNAKRAIGDLGKLIIDPPNTEITEETINLANVGINQFAIGIDPRRNFLIRKGKDAYMDEDDEGDTISNFLGINGSRGSFRGTINKPVLKLSLVHSLQRENQAIRSLIPYIEWQIESNVLFATPKSFITVTGRAGNFRQTLETALQKEAASIDFVIQN